jgi:hypothetical protein
VHDMMSMDQRTKITSKLIIVEINIFPLIQIHLSCLQRSILTLIIKFSCDSDLSDEFFHVLQQIVA